MPTGLIACVAGCVDPLTDLQNCGGCNRICIGGRWCLGGWCEEISGSEASHGADFSADGCPLNDSPGQAQPCVGPVNCRYPLEIGMERCWCPLGDDAVWECEFTVWEST